MANETREQGFFSSLRFRYGLGLAVFLGLAGYFLWEEHEAHILGYLPLFLVLGACLGMHFLMHGGHGSGSHDDGPRDRREDQ